MQVKKNKFLKKIANLEKKFEIKFYINVKFKKKCDKSDTGEVDDKNIQKSLVCSYCTKNFVCSSRNRKKPEIFCMFF